jgi:mitochondrial fission protein ELM1
VLTGAKTGDNAQVLRAARAMGLPFETKHVAVKPEFETAKPAVEASLHIVDRDASDPLAAPWPDLVITIGRRMSVVALWIKQQSGGKTRIALFNAPKGKAAAFDLVVAPGYYELADNPRLCRIGLPLIAADADRIDAARQSFAESLGAMARPLHVLLLGGDMGARALDSSFAGSLVPRMRGSHAQRGSIFVSTSRRTSAAAADAVSRELRPQDRLYRWKPDATDNPYFGLLAHGDSFTITADSLSMLTEVARLGKPIAIAAPPPAETVIARLLKRIGRAPVRDLDAASRYLIENGHAAMLGDALPASPAPPPDDTLQVAQRLRQLVPSRS